MSSLKKLFKLRCGIALGGGGVRALAHIGVLEVLEENNVKIDIIAGTSLGSFVGAAYALGMQPDIIEKKILEVCQKKEIKDLARFSTDSEIDEKKLIFQKFVRILKDLYLWNIRGARKWLVRFDRIIPLMDDFLGDKDFLDTKKPFICTASDLTSGEEVFLDKGKLLNAVLASSALPGVFPPMKIDGKLLIDGGMLGEIPTCALKKYKTDFIIGVNVESNIYREEFNTGLDILFQSELLTMHRLNKEVLNYADFIIKPKVQDVSWSDFSKAKFCIEKGKEAARERIGSLKARLRNKKYNPFYR